MGSDTDAKPSSPGSSRYTFGSKWTYYVAFSVVLFLAAFASLYAMYVLNQMDYYAARNFRLLSAWSQQLSATLANYERIFASAHRACSNFLVTELKGQDTELSLAPLSADRDPGCLNRIHDALPSSLAPAPSRDITGSFPSRAFWIDVDHIASASHSDVVLTYLSDLRLPTAGPAEIPADEDRICRLIPDTTKTPPSSNTHKRLLCRAAIPLDRLTAQLGIGAERVFDEIVLTDQHGRVLFQHGASRFQFTNLRPWIQSSLSRDTSKGTSKSDGEGSEHSLAERLPLREKIEVGGITYQVFAQPIRLPAHGAETHIRAHAAHPRQLILAGFARAETFNRQAFAIPYTVLLLIVFSVLLLLVSLPFLKLKTMGPQDRVRPVDVLTAMGACLFGTALLTFFLLDAYAYWAIKDQKDDELTFFAQTLTENMHAEIEKTMDWITTVNRRICASTNGVIPKTQRLRGRILEDAALMQALQLSQDPHPDPIMIFWVDSKGEQRAKWTVRVRPTPRINIANREYVRHVQQDELWSFHDRQGHIRRAWIQPIYAWTTGEFSAILSMRTAACPTLNTNYPVTAMQVRLSSVMQPVVPPGFGFAVIRDRDGLVLFHSKKWRALRENFFEETDDNPTLRALIFSRTSGSASGRYWGVGHRFHVRPLADLPWTLVTYMEKDPIRTFNFEVLVVSASFFLSYAAGFLVLILLLGWIAIAIRKGRTTWMWPRADYHDRYHLIIWVNGLLALGFGVHMIWNRFDWAGLLGWTILIPLSVAASLYVTLTRSRCRVASAIPKLTHAYRRSYAIMVATLMLVFSLIPALALFTITHDGEMELLVKHGQLGLARAMDERDRQLRDFYRHVKIDLDANGHGRDWHDYFERRRGLRDAASALEAPRPRDIYADFLFQVSPDARTAIHTSTNDHPTCPALLHGEPRSRAESDLVRTTVRTLWFKARALFNAPSQETAGIILHRPDNRSFRWESPAPTCVSFIHGDFRISSIIPVLSPPSFQSKGEPSSVASWGAALLAGLLLLAVVLAAFWFVLYRVPRFVADKVFLLSFDRPVDWDTFRCMIRDDAARPHPNILVIGPPGSGKSRFIKEQGWHCIDLRSLADEPDWLSASPVSEALQSANRRTIAIDHFEYGLGSPSVDRKKLTLLEALLTAGRRLCIISNVDPLSALSAPASNERQAVTMEEARLIAQRMLRVFQSFLVVYFPLRWPGYGMQGLDKQTGAARAPVSEPALTTIDQEQATLFRPYYQALWETCSDEEKIALFHLAKDRFLHADNPTLRMLLRKGLIALDPSLRLMNESFRRFILEAARDDHIVQLERRTPGSFWQALSWPLGIALLLLVLFLMVTQEQVRSAAGASLSLLPAILPVVLKLFGALQKHKTGG